MSPLSAITRLASAAAALALSGCYYPYGYYPGANGYYATGPGSAQTAAVPVTASGEPVPALDQHDQIPAPPPPSVTASGSYVVPSNTASSSSYMASQQTYVPATAPAAYPAYPYSAYPAYYGYGYGYGYPAYWGPAVSIGFGGYWGGGCCWGGGWRGGGWHGGGRFR